MEKFLTVPSEEGIVPMTVDDLNEEITKVLNKASEKILKLRTCKKDPKFSKPWWSEECSKAVALCRKAFRKVKERPTEENKIAFRKTEAKKKRTILNEKRKSWSIFCSKLSVDTPTTKVWTMIKRIKGSFSPVSYPIEQADEILSDEDKAEYFANIILPNIINIQHDQDTDKSNQISKSLTIDQNGEIQKYNDPFTQAELQWAIDSLKTKTQSGIDNIPNIFFKHLNRIMEMKLLKLINMSWETNKIPKIWKMATIIPILKPGKDTNNAKSYRPISLLSTIGKLMEKVVYNHMEWILESNLKFGNFQFGFRKGRNTMDLMIILEHTIRRALLVGDYVVCLFVDLQAAYDTIKHESVLNNLRTMGIKGKMLHWIEEFLTNRRFKVLVNGSLSTERILTTGTPQGSILSPLLFNIITSNLPTSENTEKVAFADDIKYYTRNKYLTKCLQYIQAAATVLKDWTEENGLILNPAKSKVMIFTRKRIDMTNIIPIKIGNISISFETTHKGLGMTLDAPKLTWKPHIDRIKTENINRLQTLKAVTGTTWGADRKMLKIMFKSFVLSKINYGSILYDSASETNLKSLDIIQNAGLRIITGNRKTTPIPSLICESDMLPLKIERQKLNLEAFLKLAHFGYLNSTNVMND
ncbi:unnamed protein product [Rotaria socialis]|uniref:Reverse transcriptase domain-containing protein n=1 Tax=Rotaria socialis TaxID=392032 RepID=A0A821SVA6_9BILA|nr:unnamed protein product [Rotaria socialis]CAF4865925.1 unnamed protein product [Rotaria socialis]